jgi:glycosyltransferase involved in cell wall biosynthesis
MKIALVCQEYFDYAKINNDIKPSKAHGGFGFLTRLKAEALAKSGYDVHVLTASENNGLRAAKLFELNGVIVHTFRISNGAPRSFIKKAWMGVIGNRKNIEFENILRGIKPDIIQYEDAPKIIFQNQNLSIPQLLIFQDLQDYYDVNLVSDSEKQYQSIPSSGVLGYNIKPKDYKFRGTFLINLHYRKNYVAPLKKFIKTAKTLHLFAEAKCISKKSYDLLSLEKHPDVLLNPINIPDITEQKSDTPSLVWIARWDSVKRPDVALEIAKRIPNCDFYFVGKASENDMNYEKIENYLIHRFSKIKNIHILGFISEEEKVRLLGKAWGFLNTSIREGLPSTFLESLAERTPIISYVDPDNYVSNWGIKVDYDIESYVTAIKRLIAEEQFKRLGAAARNFVIENHETAGVVKRHLQIYKEYLNEA